MTKEISEVNVIVPIVTCHLSNHPTYVDESTPFRKENDLELYLIDETLGPVLRMHSQLKV